MIVSVGNSTPDDKYRIKITVSSYGEDDIVFFKDMKELIDFIEVLRIELVNNHITIPKAISTMSHAEFGSILTTILNHETMSKLLKVKGFFVTVGKTKLQRSMTIASRKVLSQSTMSSMKKPSETLNGIIQLDGVKELEKSYIDITNPYLISYVQSLGYSEVTGLGNGTSKAVFKAKNTKGYFVAVKVGKLQYEAKLTKEKSITNTIGQKMSRTLFGGFLYIYKVSTDTANNFILIEYYLANKTLRDIIIEKREKAEIFTQEELTRIVQDLVECLYHMHVQNQVVHRDIKPQNIFYTDHRYTFGDYGEAEQKNVNILDKRIKMKMCELKGTPMYMETKLLRLCNRTSLETKLTSSVVLMESQVIKLRDGVFEYDPFKADIYSLGLVFFELMLHNDGYTLDEQIYTLFYWQRAYKLFDDLVKSFDLRSKYEKYILMKGKVFEVPSLLERMLEESYTERITTFELSLLSTHKTCILGNILTPFTDIFLPRREQFEGNKQKVEYNYKMMVYIGEFRDGQRDGYGIMYRNTKHMPIDTDVIMEEDSDLEDSQDSNYQSMIRSNMPNVKTEPLENLISLYEGRWRADLPNKFGSLKLNDSDNRYKGYFCDGTFDGYGEVYFKDKLLYKAQWKSNYNDHMLKPVETFKRGIYRFRDICRESQTVYGFYYETEEPIKRFVIGINHDMKEYLRSVISETIRVVCQTPVTSIRLNKNTLYSYDELILESSNETISYCYSSNNELTTWLLNQVIMNFSLYNLKEINLEMTEILESPIVSLAKRLDCFSLTSLNLSECHSISSKALNSLFGSSMVNQMLKLNLSSTQISDKTMQALADSKYLTRLRYMTLRMCRYITNSGFKTWVSSKNVKELEYLDMSDTYLGQGFIDGLSVENHLKKLKRLRIFNVPLTSQDMHFLSTNKAFSSLTDLHCSIKWLPHLTTMEKLRIICFRGEEKAPRKQFIEFLEAWNHNKLEITLISQLTERDSLSKCEEYYKQPFEKILSKLVISCLDSSLKLIADPISGVVFSVTIENKENANVFAYKLSTGFFQNGKNSQLKELLIKHNSSFKECFDKLFTCDFSDMKIEKVTVLGYLDEERISNTKAAAEISKQKILQLSEFIKDIVTVIKPSQISIPEIFQKDNMISMHIKDKIAELSEVQINWKSNQNRRILLNNAEHLGLCKTTSNATLDYTLHALAASECLAHLTYLNLKGRNNVTDKGLGYIVNSRYCSKILTLELSGTYISSNIFLLLKASDHMHLKNLLMNNLPGTLNFYDVYTYVNSDNARQLKKLQIRNSNLNPLDLFFLKLNLYNLYELDETFSPDMESSISYLPQLIETAKFSKLRRVYLDLSKCRARSILKSILKCLGSEKLQRLKLNLSSMTFTDDMTEEDLSYEIFQANLNRFRGGYFQELNLIFSRTTVHRYHFFEFMSSLTVAVLRLSFSERFDNKDVFQLKNSMKKTENTISTFEWNIDRCSYINSEYSCEYIAEIFRGLTQVQTLALNFSYCRYVTKWRTVLSGLKELTTVKAFYANLETCRLTDETDIICEWITTKIFTQPERKLKFMLNITNCWRIQGNDRCFFNLLKLISDKSRYGAKIKLLMRKIKLPLDMKNKLLTLKGKPEYELQFGYKYD